MNNFAHLMSVIKGMAYSIANLRALYPCVMNEDTLYMSLSFVLRLSINY